MLKLHVAYCVQQSYHVENHDFHAEMHILEATDRSLGPSAWVVGSTGAHVPVQPLAATTPRKGAETDAACQTENAWSGGTPVVAAGAPDRTRPQLPDRLFCNGHPRPRGWATLCPHSTHIWSTSCGLLRSRYQRLFSVSVYPSFLPAGAARVRHRRQASSVAPPSGAPVKTRRSTSRVPRATKCAMHVMPRSAPSREPPRSGPTQTRSAVFAGSIWHVRAIAIWQTRHAWRSARWHHRPARTRWRRRRPASAASVPRSARRMADEAPPPHAPLRALFSQCALLARPMVRRVVRFAKLAWD